MLLLPETLTQRREALEDALREGRIPDALEHSRHLSSRRVADLLAQGPSESAVELLESLPPERAGVLLAHMAPPLAADILDGLSDEDAGELFRNIAPESAADVYYVWQERDRLRADQILDAVDEPNRSLIRNLGRYAPGTAGAAMTLRFLAIPTGTSVGETVNAIEAAPPEVERSSYVYVLDQEGRAVGVVSVRNLHLAGPDEVVDRIMDPHLVAVRGDYDSVDAARLLRNRGFRMVPVLDDENHLLGVLTQEDAFELLTEEVAREFTRSAQASPDESFFTPPMGAVRRRLPWMGANVFLNLGAVFVISSFESTIAQVAILAAFLPMITDMGGNVGIQALSVAIRSIALDEVRILALWRAVRKEVLIGLVNGAALGTLFAVIAVILEGNAWLGMVAGLALGINVLVAGVVGGTLPFLIKRMGKDPAMMTGPFLTTITDITGVTIYLGMSTLFLTQILA